MIDLLMLQCPAMAGEFYCGLNRLEGVSSGTFLGVLADGHHCGCASRGCQASVLAIILVSSRFDLLLTSSQAQEIQAGDCFLVFDCL